MTAPSGWLELDGSTISTTTYANLFGVMSLSQNGTRTSGSAIITGLGSTTTIKAGYYVFGTGITTGTTVLSVDSGAQITMSANAGSSGTSTVIVSPWLLNTGTIKLPDLVTSGRYRRSRTSATAPGQVQADQYTAHTHSVSGNTGTESGNHQHDINFFSGTETATHAHNTSISVVGNVVLAGGGGTGVLSSNAGTPTNFASAVENGTHAHPVTGTSNSQNSNHTHNIALTTSTAGGAATETRPLSMVFITCVKT